MKSFVTLLLVAALGYTAWAYWPVASHYFEIRYLAQKLANGAFEGSIRSNTDAMRTKIRQSTGIRLTAGDITVRPRSEGTRVDVRIRTVVNFPLTSLSHRFRFVISASSHRKGSRKTK